MPDSAMAGHRDFCSIFGEAKKASATTKGCAPCVGPEQGSIAFVLIFGSFYQENGEALLNTIKNKQLRKKNKAIAASDSNNQLNQYITSFINH